MNALGGLGDTAPQPGSVRPVSWPLGVCILDREDPGLPFQLQHILTVHWHSGSISLSHLPQLENEKVNITLEFAVKIREMPVEPSRDSLAPVGVQLLGVAVILPTERGSPTPASRTLRRGKWQSSQEGQIKPRALAPMSERVC